MGYRSKISILVCIFVLLFLTNTPTFYASAILDTSSKDSVNEIDMRMVNAFTGCSIRVMNFRGLDLDFQTAKVPILLIRFLSHCDTIELFPYEISSIYPALQLQNLSTCYNSRAYKTYLPPKDVAISYVAQTEAESFQIKSKNVMCEADIYVQPPTEQNSPQLYWEGWNWESVLKSPTMANYYITYDTQKWKWDYINTVPMISLLICNSTKGSICGNENEVKKWVASLFFDPLVVRLSVSVLIWEYTSFSLKTLCPYCDPCDSFKIIPLTAKNVPNSRNELEIILQESHQLNPGPHSVRVLLRGDPTKTKNILNQQAVLNVIQRYPVEYDMGPLYMLADEHLIPFLLPKSTNITFSIYSGIYVDKWKNIIIDSCSPTKFVNSHPSFRPEILRSVKLNQNLLQEPRLVTSNSQLRTVSCHKKSAHWANQLPELVSAFDISTWSAILATCVLASWILKLSTNSNGSRNKGIFDLTFVFFGSILDQSSSLFSTSVKSSKSSFFLCVFCVPIAWMYLSTLYKGDNITRLTAEPPLIPFDTLKSIDEYHFTTYSRRFHILSLVDTSFFSLGSRSELSTILKKHDLSGAHEAFPIVSEIWYGIMVSYRPTVSSYFKWCLYCLKKEIPEEIWKLINNSAMLPDKGQGLYENITTIINIHMNKCNMSAIILTNPSALQMQTVLKVMNKPAFLGKNEILKKFWGYNFAGHFPPQLIFRVKYLFDAGIFKWWQNHIEYSIILKANVHATKLLPKTYDQNATSDDTASKTAITVLSLIHGVGLLICLLVFMFVDMSLIKIVFSSLKNLLKRTVRLCRRISTLVFKLHLRVKNAILSNKQPKEIHLDDLN